MESGVRGKGDLIFQIIGHILLMVMSLLAILPFLLLIISSFTEEQSLLKYGYSFFPKEFSAYAYEYLFGANAANIFNAYKITILVTVLGTMISLFIGAMGGYVLSRRDYPRRKAMSFYVFFTMLFNGGLVPSYMMWTQVFHVKNSFFALLLPTLLLNGFNMMLLRGNFQSNIHPALIEAAKIDGAGEFFIFRKIVLPLSLPIMAAIGLMTGIGYWNDWTNGLYYISESRLFSLQQLLNNILNNVKALSSLSTAVSVANDMPSTSIRMAMAVVGVLPILVLYPFFQKYFVKGISLGGVKE
ncbi:MAG: carbohydrate ABC transporter permease [Lachnospiraceae bacterium]|nr:carbohydrate ABC transporter permease [Lachnospiraceae bacterium]